MRRIHSAGQLCNNDTSVLRREKRQKIIFKLKNFQCLVNNFFFHVFKESLTHTPVDVPLVSFFLFSEVIDLGKLNTGKNAFFSGNLTQFCFIIIF